MVALSSTNFFSSQEKSDKHYRIGLEDVKNKAFTKEYLCFEQELLRLIEISNFSDKLGKFTFIGNQYFMEMLGLSERTTQRYFHTAEKKRGVIIRNPQTRRKSGRFTSSRKTYFGSNYAPTRMFHRPPFVADKLDITILNTIKEKRDKKKSATSSMVASLPSPSRKKEKDNAMKKEPEKPKPPKKPPRPKIILNTDTLKFEGITKQDEQNWEKINPNWREDLKSLALWLVNPEKEKKWPKSLKTGKSLKSFLDKCMVKSLPKNNSQCYRNKSFTEKKPSDIQAEQNKYIEIKKLYLEHDIESGMTIEEIKKIRKINPEYEKLYVGSIKFQREMRGIA